MPSKPKSKSTRSSRSAIAPVVSSTAVVVRDRAASLRWYTEVLGLKVAVPGDHWVTVGNSEEGGAIHLCQGSELDPPAPLEPGNTGILLLLEGDFRANCAELKKRGIEFVDGPTQRPWGWDATIRDPDGNELLLMPSE
jgi:catechol 2,3-dioxygenase-like lactoylglutathione lyase family enzyme